ncbi:MAG TPA: hypothetical protein VJ785_11970 [Anaerolineales bacterium]|nr:hypothetical protein [Anaerolineales bacterium]
MNKKLIYTLTLFTLVALWGAFTFAAPVSAGPEAQETVIVPTVASTIVPPDVNITAVVPVTGEDEAATTNIMTLLFYGFLGLLAVVLLVALFASANRTTYIRRDGPPPPPDNL